MKRKLIKNLMLLLTLIVLCLAVGLTASAETWGDYEYTVLDDGTVEITGYGSSDKFPVVPAEIEGRKVTSISGLNRGIKSMILPDSVENIGASAFIRYAVLETVVLGDGVKTIAEGAFDKCYSLKTVYIGKSLNTIEGNIFMGSFGLEKFIVDPENETFYSDEYGVLYNKKTKSLVAYPASAPMTSYEIAEGTEIVSELAFQNSLYLKEILFPESLHTIETGAFLCASGIESITIPKTVKHIGFAFANCFSLKEVYILNPDIEFDGFVTMTIATIEGMTCIEFAQCLRKMEIAFIYDDPENITEFEANYLDHMITYEEPIYDTITIYCHDDGRSYTAEGQNAYGIPVERYHAYAEKWTYDWENYVRYRECTFENCDAAIKENLETTENGDVEIIEPADPDTDFVVDVITDYVIIEEALTNGVEDNWEIIKAFDITMTGKDGVHVQPDGTVKVKLPNDWSKNGVYKVYRVNNDGTLTDMNAYRQGSHLVFDTDHFSVYVIVVEGAENEAPTEPDIPATPDEETKDDFFSKIFDLIKAFIDLLFGFINR